MTEFCVAGWLGLGGRGMAQSARHGLASASRRPRRISRVGERAAPRVLIGQGARAWMANGEGARQGAAVLRGLHGPRRRELGGQNNGEQRGWNSKWPAVEHGQGNGRAWRGRGDESGWFRSLGGWLGAAEVEEHTRAREPRA